MFFSISVISSKNSSEEFAIFNLRFPSYDISITLIVAETFIMHFHFIVFISFN
jgi:hypothetical protein